MRISFFLFKYFMGSCFEDAGAVPVCEPISCGNPPGVENGFSLNATDRIVFGESALYTCSKGFYISGIAS